VSTDTREQIVEATVRVLAREGVHGLSFAKVVDEAQLSSTRLISYHYGTREALLQETFAHVLARAAAFMGPRIAAEDSIRAKITAYITSNLEFIAEDEAYARAAVELAGNLANPNGGQGLELLEAGFTAGQAAGELRDFDVRAMALALRGSIDATVVAIVNGTVDPTAAAHELADLYDRAISA
jgi:AcrR family transcriptional regulator